MNYPCEKVELISKNMYFEGKEFQDVPMASFLSVPLVVRIKVLSYLTLKEQLQLRQVSKTTRQWIDSSSLPYHAPVTIIVDHGSKTFIKFLEKTSPHVIKSVYLKNETEDFLNDPTLSYFMRIHSSSITSLRMQRFFPCKSPKEIAFFEGFKNLIELQLDKVSISSENEIVSSFPSVFKNLKTLKIGNVKAYPEPPDDTFGSALIPLARQRPMGLYVWDLIRYCENVEFLGYPQTSKYFFQAFTDGHGRGEFGVFCDFVRERRIRCPNGTHLKYCDFQNDNWAPDIRNALSVLKLGSEFGIKFLNLNPNLFQFIKIDSLIKMYDLPQNAGDCILSFKNFNCLITKCLPSVQKISMSASEVNTMLDYSCIFNGPKTFPNLKEIEIIMDVGFSLPETDIYHRAREFRNVQTLLSHFFYNTEMILLEDVLTHVRVYESVHSLIIKFTDLPSTSMRKANPEDLPLEWIVKSLPNLQKLTLHGWSTQQKGTYSTIWNSFPKLEQLVLENCENLEWPCFHGSCKNLVRITMKGNSSNFGLIDGRFHDFMEDKDLRPSVFLNKSSEEQQQMTWSKFAEEG